MRSIDVLNVDGVHEIQGIPPHRLKPKAAAKGAKGFIWVTSCDVFKKLSETNDVIPNTTKRDIVNGDYGAAMLDDGGYWLVCDASTKERWDNSNFKGL